MTTKIYLVALAVSIAMVAAYHGPDLPPGPFCGLRGHKGGCCQDRMDTCSHRILDTICYCDEFCNLTRVVDDCCPDYEEVCLGQVAPQPIVRGVCYLGQTKMDLCNKCHCIEVSGRPDWQCTKDDCMMSEDVIKGVNPGKDGWRAAVYSQFGDKKLKEALLYRTGTLPLHPFTRRMGAIRYDMDIDYPEEFDARKRWPQYISPVVDQGWCGSDWAVSIASLVSDRFAILSNGAESLPLSPQSLLSCNKRGQQGCDGGHIDIAWNFVGQYGIVDEACFPYVAYVTKCPYALQSNLLQAGCRPQISNRQSKYKVSVPYRLKAESDIMWELMERGPMQAVMTVHQDFFHYRDGIYRHTGHGNRVQYQLHSVKIIGWGEERGVKYWIVANSWGQDWGENGYFRILRGSDESGIESFVITVLPEDLEADPRKQTRPYLVTPVCTAKVFRTSKGFSNNTRYSGVDDTFY